MLMTKELTVFKFNEYTIRRITGVDGKILFCIADICAALGIKRIDDVIARLTKEADNNRPLCNSDTGNNGVAIGGVIWINIQTAGGVQRMAFTDEVGLYDIISKSRKPLSKVLYRRLIEAVPPMRQQAMSPQIAPAYSHDLAHVKALTQELISCLLPLKDVFSDLATLKSDVSQLKSGQEVKALLPPVPPLTRRNEIILFINKYMANHPGEFAEFEHIWNHLYDAFRLRTGRNIKREARPRFKSTLAYVQYVGEIDRLWVVAKDLFDK